MVRPLAEGERWKHARDGIAAFYGVRIRQGDLGTLEIQDVAPTLLDLLELPVADGLDHAHLSARAALSAYRAASGWPAAPRPVRSSELLPERALAGDGHARRHLVDEVYLPLVHARGTLIETLSVYLESGGSIEATGRALFVHPNTVRYRLKQVAELTVKCLKATTPASVPGIAFLSGGQSDEQATENLSLINQIGDLPWKVTFSYGRALQAAALKAWGGKTENAAAGQRAFTHRARMNSLAALGKWNQQLEKAA